MARTTSRTVHRIVREATFHDVAHGYDVFGLHPPTLARAVDLAAAVYERYFRVDSHGIENVPQRGAAILVANHAGALPIDAALLCLDVLRRTEPPRIPRPIADHFVPRLPGFGTLAARLGMVDGTRSSARILIERGELLIVWPEGVSGPAKRFSARYRLQHWCEGFAELAIHHRVPVIPVAIVGAEESWPLIGKLRHFHPFAAPYVPVPATPVPLPAHYYLRYGEALRLDRGTRDDEAPDLVTNGATRVRVALENLLARSCDERKGVFR